MDFLNIFIRSIGSIISLFFLTKIMGKKQVSQLNLFDYTIGITIGSVAAEISVSKTTPFWDGVIVMVTYTVISIIFAYITTKSIVLRRFISGVPIVLISNGKIIEQGLNKAKFDINDLLEESRRNGYFDISEIEYAVMEQNGSVSFLPKSKYVPITPNDMKLKVNYKGLTANLVIDGKIMHNNLKMIDKDEKWLLTRIKNNNKELNNILLLTCDTKEKITIYEKNEKLSTRSVLE